MISITIPRVLSLHNADAPDFNGFCHWDNLRYSPVCEEDSTPEKLALTIAGLERFTYALKQMNKDLNGINSR